MDLAGVVEGQGTIQGYPQQTLLLGGVAYGYGTVLSGTQPYAGVLQGYSNVTGLLTRILTFSGRVRGVGRLRDSAPYLLTGHGTVMAFMEVGAADQPICGNTTVRELPYGTSLDIFQLSICDERGNPYGPPIVRYAVYRVLPTGVRVLHGPAQRVPVQDGVGRYHASGYIGECGQPGEWFIVWSWLQNGVCHTKEEPFVLTSEVATLACGCGVESW